MKNNYLKQLLILVFLFSTSYTFAQVITTNPAFPTENSAVTITFHALEGSAGLADYIGDVYAHTGVMTSEGDWQYAPASWGDNSAKYKLTKVDGNTYELAITPSVREYYGVPEGETINQMAFVFRSADNSKEGKDIGGTDIFYDIYTSDLSINILKPTQNNEIVALNTIVEIQAQTNISADLEITLDGNSLTTITGTEISTTYETTVSGSHEIIISATDDIGTVTESIYFYTEPTTISQAIPDGIIKGINYDANDNTKATLLLYAPYKEYVFVVGDFNDWLLSENYLMKKEDDYFWLTLEGLTPNKEYSFQYLIDGEIKIADPYAEKLSDSNDKWINENYSVYPNLIAYPEGKADGVASVLETNRTEYAWNITDFQRPAINKMIIYELHLRDFTVEGTINAAFAKLDYIQDLGINVIELMPFNEFEGNDSWGYNPSFYFAPDKAYGTREDYKAFIDECHARGIAVVQDMVLNHSFGQSPFLQMYFTPDDNWGKPSTENPWYNVDSPNTSYSWGVDFDHESVQTKELVDSVCSFWINEYKVDGYRFDFTKGFTNVGGDGWAKDESRIQILKRMSDEIWKLDESGTNRAYVILEHLAVNSEETILANYGMLMWGNMNHSYNENTMAWFGSGKSDLGYASYTSRNWIYPNLITYMESHDEERLMFKNLEYGNSFGEYNIQEPDFAYQRIEQAAVFFIPIPGPKMIWQFGELGYDYSIDENGRVGRKPVRWDYFEKNNRNKLYQVYAALNKLKRNEIAFTTNDITLSVGDYAQKRIVLKHEDMDVVILGNFGVEEGLTSPTFTKTGTWFEFFTGNSIEVSDVNADLLLQAGEYRIYTTKELEKPDIPETILAIAETKSSKYQVYPNPANDLISIDSKKQIQKLEIYNLLGEKVFQKDNNLGSNPKINISSINSGIYILNIYSEQTKISQKIIIE